MGVRLGLLNQDHSKALIFEVDSAKMKGSAEKILYLAITCGFFVTNSWGICVSCNVALVNTTFVVCSSTTGLLC